MAPQPTVGLYLQLSAQKDKKDDLRNLLLKGSTLLESEPLTLQWYALEHATDSSKFVIFDTFHSAEGVTAHKEGAVASTLIQNGSALLAEGSGVDIQQNEILASVVRKGEGKLGLRVLAKAKPEKAEEVEKFLKSAVSLVEAEPLTLQWFTFKINGTNTFGIIDFFEDNDGRNAHLNGKVAEALFAKAEELFESSPEIVFVDVIASRVL